MIYTLDQLPADVTLRFNMLINAAFRSLADPLPDSARVPLETFLSTVVSVDDLISVSLNKANPARLRASCFSMLREVYVWSLTQSRRKIYADAVIEGTRDEDPSVRLEALEALENVADDDILQHRDEHLPTLARLEEIKLSDVDASVRLRAERVTVLLATSRCIYNEESERLYT